MREQQVNSLRKCAEQLSEDVADLCLPVGGAIAELSATPTPLQFLRDWCTPNKPFIVRGGVKDWPAAKHWTPDYFRERYGNKEVTVAVTPDGYADAICGEYFVLPEERRMSMSQFLDILDRPQKDGDVYYIQKQNSNLTEEFPELLTDVPSDIWWASEALNKQPDAVNFWMGDGRAVTSLHKDHYENIYCVLSGHKDFCLLPPTDRAWIPYRACRPATYRRLGGTLQPVPAPAATPAVPWADLDPLDPLDPGLTRVHVHRCRLGPGDLLYLPALWFHHVTQSHGCVAVNYWYDMEYDVKYCYFRFLESLFSSDAVQPS